MPRLLNRGAHASDTGRNQKSRLSNKKRRSPNPSGSVIGQSERPKIPETLVVLVPMFREHRRIAGRPPDDGRLAVFGRSDRFCVWIAIVRDTLLLPEAKYPRTGMMCSCYQTKLRRIWLSL